MIRIDFVEVQFPVGQGGFHAGWLVEHGLSLGIDPLVGEPAFAWAYDCGSNQQDVLNEQIQTIAGARLDMLFLSHLDGDHVVGVDKLLLAADSVDEVILPYLNGVEWALHLAAAAGRGSLSGTFIDLVASPSDWFGVRGVQRITYIDGHSEDDEGPDGPDPIDPSRLLSVEPWIIVEAVDVLEGRHGQCDLAQVQCLDVWGQRLWSRNPQLCRCQPSGLLPSGSPAKVSTNPMIGKIDL